MLVANTGRLIGFFFSAGRTSKTLAETLDGTLKVILYTVIYRWSCYGGIVFRIASFKRQILDKCYILSSDESSISETQSEERDVKFSSTQWLFTW